MWNPSRILVIPAFPTQRDSNGNVIGYASGFFMLIDPALMADDLKPYQINLPPPVQWSGGSSVYLGFPDEKTATGTSLGAQYLADTAAMPASWSVPQRVDAHQLKLALYQAGLYDNITAFVATQAKDVQIAWDSAPYFNRDNAMLNGAATAFGMTAAQMDQIFVAAASIA